MGICATFERNGISKEYELPLDKSDVVDIRRELGISNDEMFNWKDFSDENIFPNTTIGYKETGYERTPDAIFCVIHSSIECSFLEVNILAYVMQCYLYNDKVDALNIYTEYDPPCDVLELMNYIISMEEIYDYYYVSQYECSCVEEGYAKTEYGNEFPAEYWGYVDFTRIGDEDGQNSVWFGDDGWMYDSDMSKITISNKSFEQLLEDFEWELTPPSLMQFDATDIMEFLNEV